MTTFRCASFCGLLLAALIPAAINYYPVFMYGGMGISSVLYLVGWRLAYGIITAAYIFYQLRS